LAKSKFEELKFAQEGKPIEPVSLEKLLSSEISQSPYVIDDLLVAQGKAFLVAKAKSGKTTLCLALLKSLVTGQPFLGLPINLQRWQERLAYIDYISMLAEI
jgi:RecA-family ATPase